MNEIERWKDIASFQKDNPSGAVDLSDISDIELAEAGGGVGTAVFASLGCCWCVNTWVYSGIMTVCGIICPNQPTCPR